MRASFGNPEAVAREIQGRFTPGRDVIVRPPKFGDVCRLLWPNKTAAELAAIGNRDERSAKRWLAGEYEPPLIVILAVVAKMFERS